MKKFYGDHYRVELDEFVTVVKKLYNFMLILLLHHQRKIVKGLHLDLVTQLIY